MSWLDVVAFIAYIGLLSLAYRRGFIQECADLLALLAGGFLGFRLFRAIADFLHAGFLSAWNLAFLHKFIFFIIFLSTFLVIYGIGINLERRLNETRVIDKTANCYAGLGLGLFKSAWLVSLLLALFFYLGLVPPRMVVELREGVVVRAFTSLSTAVVPSVYLMAPYDLAEDFMNRGYARSKR